MDIATSVCLYEPHLCDYNSSDCQSSCQYIFLVYFRFKPHDNSHNCKNVYKLICECLIIIEVIKEMGKRFCCRHCKVCNTKYTEQILR